MKNNSFISAGMIYLVVRAEAPWYLLLLFIICLVADITLSIAGAYAESERNKKLMEYFKEVNRFAENKINVIDAINSNQQRLFEQSTFIRKKLDEQEVQLKKIQMHVLGKNDGS